MGDGLTGDHRGEWRARLESAGGPRRIRGRVTARLRSDAPLGPGRGRHLEPVDVCGPEGRGLVGSRGRGDAELVDLRQWPCARHPGGAYRVGSRRRRGTPVQLRITDSVGGRVEHLCGVGRAMAGLDTVVSIVAAGGAVPAGQHSRQAHAAKECWGSGGIGQRRDRQARGQRRRDRRLRRADGGRIRSSRQHRAVGGYELRWACGRCQLRVRARRRCQSTQRVAGDDPVGTRERRLLPSLVEAGCGRVVRTVVGATHGRRRHRQRVIARRGRPTRSFRIGALRRRQWRVGGARQRAVGRPGKVAGGTRRHWLRPSYVGATGVDRTWRRALVVGSDVARPRSWRGRPGWPAASRRRRRGLGPGVAAGQLAAGGEKLAQRVEPSRRASSAIG